MFEWSQGGQCLAGVWGREEALLEGAEQERVYLWYLTCKEDVTVAFYPISVSGDSEDDLAASTPSMWDSAFLITLILGHFFTRDRQTALWLWLGVSGSDCIASLAQSRVVLGRTQDPPSGPTTSSKAPHSQSMFVLVRGTQSSFQRNPSLKWNISTEACVAPSDTNIQSSVNNHSLSYCHLNLNSSCNIAVSLSASFLPPCFHFLSAPPWPCCLHFPPLSPHFSLDFSSCSSDRLAPHPCFIGLWAHPCCKSGQCSANGPVIYSRLDWCAKTVSGYADLLRQAHWNRSLHLNIAPNVGVCECVCEWETEREK